MALCRAVSVQIVGMCAWGVSTLNKNRAAWLEGDTVPLSLHNRGQSMRTDAELVG